MAYSTSRPRESTYPYPLTQDFQHHLEDCISATEACSSTLSSGLNKLAKGTMDLPRLSKILRNKHHFLVLPTPTISAHKSALSTSLAPQIDQLIAKAEMGVEAEKAKVVNLEERLSILQSARLPRQQQEEYKKRKEKQDHLEMEMDTDRGVGEGEGSKLDGLDMKELNMAQRRKVMMLKGKRERLEKERARLME